MKIGSAFSGIGAWERALELLETKHEIVFFSEIDSNAIKTYSEMFKVPVTKNLGDITSVDTETIGDIDVFFFSPPCQSWSVAGEQGGFEDPRGVLFFDALRIIRAKKPKYALMENVKNLVSKKFTNEFKAMLRALDDAGYVSYWKILNAVDYGIPQNRQRVFIVSVRKDLDTGTFEFPDPVGCELRLIDLLEDEVDEKYFIPDWKAQELLKEYESQLNRTKKVLRDRGKLRVGGDISTCIDANYHKGMDNHAQRTMIAVPCITPDRLHKRQNGRRFKEDGDPMFTITAMDRHGVLVKIGFLGSDSQGNRVYDSDGVACTQCGTAGGLGGKTGLYKVGYRIRRLTPLECIRLMGFTDNDYKLMKSLGISDTGVYKMAGNSICVPVLNHLLRKIPIIGNIAYA